MNFDFLTGLFKTQAQEIAEINQQKVQAMAGGINLGCIDPYQQYANQQNTVTTTSTGYYYSGPAGPLVGGGGGAGTARYVSTVGYPTVNLQPLTGVRITIAFTDARGTVFALEVDQAYAGLLTQISHNHAYYVPQQATIGTGYIPPIKVSPPPKMLDGDFTEDEMTQAEQIIQEMGGSNGQEPYQAA